ncbi:DUF3231 family protein [Oceanobacillus neutriphilus]|uniref:DUF3231 family protein n=1 Tax=Oceanobacillus neutriphilus TaxID=531815 RepID=A0ABQ2NSU3_9BACI|nr:DUF3231 family protein [Oceanobacillus neutriphilus]GGP08905.1 hypothetical protein GCM10011346_11090 [Oceanobacillus neutriphilus]
MDKKNIHLTAAEIASVWTGYLNDTLAKCILSFMLKHMEDSEIKPVVQHAFDNFTNQIDQLHQIFEEENFATPNGFTEKDVNMNAPWLFTDAFCLTYVTHMARIGMITYSGFVAMSIKKEIRDYSIHALHDMTALYDHAVQVALEKGINSRPPYIEIPKETNYVDSKKYMSGLNPFSEKRPLNAVEISQLYMNIQTNEMGIKLCLAFAQTSPTKVVQDFMLRAKNISQKHIKIFVDNLMQDEIGAPQLPDIAVSDSTTQTFSDKLMMFHMSLIMSAGVGNYATAAAASQRLDLAASYERLSMEVTKLAKSGADIMIDNNWLEQPPGTKNREKLAKNKGKS